MNHYLFELREVNINKMFFQTSYNKRAFSLFWWFTYRIISSKTMWLNLTWINLIFNQKIFYNRETIHCIRISLYWLNVPSFYLDWLRSLNKEKVFLFEFNRVGGRGVWKTFAVFHNSTQLLIFHSIGSWEICFKKD